MNCTKSDTGANRTPASKSKTSAIDTALVHQNRTRCARTTHCCWHSNETKYLCEPSESHRTCRSALEVCASSTNTYGTGLMACGPRASACTCSTSFRLNWGYTAVEAYDVGRALVGFGLAQKAHTHISAATPVCCGSALSVQ